jgi:hypothetical protein
MKNWKKWSMKMKNAENENERNEKMRPVGDRWESHWDFNLG